MKNKYTIALLILFAFIAGFGFFWIITSSSKISITPENMNNTVESYKVSDKVPSEEEKLPNILKSNSLDISGQGLDKLPSYVLSRTNLEELDISDNNITGALPSEIGKLTNLKVLNASDNKMTGVPAEVGQLTDLEVLDLSNNMLTGLPNELGKLKNLKILDLSGNDYAEQDLNVIREGLPSDVRIITD